MDKHTWNEKARKQNTKMFQKEFGRDPEDYEEVRIWVQGLIDECDSQPGACSQLLPQTPITAIK